MSRSLRPRSQQPRAGATALRMPSTWGTALTFVLAIVFGGGNNIPALLALVVICGIWIWYERG
jgi:hypothetical protein